MAAKPLEDGDAMLDRFLALRRWLRDLDVCWSCQSTLAWVQVEREKSGIAVTAVLECKTPDRCRARANAGRQSMPR